MKKNYQDLLFLLFIFSLLSFLDKGIVPFSREAEVYQQQDMGESIPAQNIFLLRPDVYRATSSENFVSQQDVIVQAPQPKKVPGLSYKIRSGETLSSIAVKFRVTIKSLLSANGLTDQSIIKAGETLLVPGAVQTLIARANYIPAAAYINAKASISGELTAPISGYNWGNLHPTNAVDIANNCGTPVYASHAGIITMSRIGWNGGGGNTVEITAPRGFATRYGHLDTIYVQEGASISGGDLLGLVGNTGKTVGYTGCHVHFEVRGLENPLIR